MEFGLYASRIALKICAINEPAGRIKSTRKVGQIMNIDADKNARESELYELANSAKLSEAEPAILTIAARAREHKSADYDAQSIRVCPNLAG